MRAFFVLSALIALLHGNGIEWVDDYQAAVDKAAVEHKNIYLKITTKECGWCRRLERFTLSDEEVVARLNRDYVSVQVTRNVDPYPEKFTAKMVPMSYIVTPEGEEVYGALGFMDMEEFLLMLDEAEETYQELFKEEK